MQTKVVLLSGPICSGKTTLASKLGNQPNVLLLKTKQLILQRRQDTKNSRIELQKVGEELDKETDGRWLCEELSPKITESNHNLFVIDSVRIKEQVDEIRKGFGAKVVHVHLTAGDNVLEERFNERTSGTVEPSYKDAKRNKTEQSVSDLKDCADIVIDTERCSPEDVFIRVAARIGFYPKTIDRLVDVIVGGQYGSEGKGHLCSYLAPEYDYLVRVGGPNAGHTVKKGDGEKSVFKLLPSGSLHAENAKLIIPPGMVLDIEQLLKEITENSIAYERIFIDPQAMVIGKEDRNKEAGILKKISSTLQGVGAATARKILYRNPDRKPKLAGDFVELKHYLRPTHEVLREAYSSNKRILLEGTQGTGLSIHHGSYPHVTSRDTSVSGCLSEAGISPTRVRKVVMVCRSYPIRVGSKPEEGVDSGPMRNEISWKEVSKRSGISEKELKGTELTTNTKKLRRVAEFDWEQLYTSACLNAPTDIALTFADQISEKNKKARRFEQLTQETLQFIEEIERVSGAPVSLISTRFHQRSIIDRRKW